MCVALMRYTQNPLSHKILDWGTERDLCMKWLLPLDDPLLYLILTFFFFFFFFILVSKINFQTAIDYKLTVNYVIPETKHWALHQLSNEGKLYEPFTLPDRSSNTLLACLRDMGILSYTYQGMDCWHRSLVDMSPIFPDYSTPRINWYFLRTELGFRHMVGVEVAKRVGHELQMNPEV
jgi:hypothetical protein